jgi:phospholipase C
MRHPLLLGLAASGLVWTAGCSSGDGGSLGPRSAPLVARPASASQVLSHVVVIIQENRSFENFFAGYPGANAPTSGCAIPVTSSGRGSIRSGGIRPLHSRTNPGSSSLCPPGDISVALQETTLNGPVDLQHNWRSSKVSWDKGKMDGFSKFGVAGKYEAYEYVNPEDIAPYWDMAEQYVLADAMFPTEFGGSFTAHLTLVAGNDNIRQSPSEAEVDFPNGRYDDCDSPPGSTSSYLTSNDVEHYQQGPFPCFDQWDTIANVLDEAGISWKYYANKMLDAGFWEPFEAMKYTRYGPDWTTSIIAPQTQVLEDAADGNLASVTFVSPSKADSDHPHDGDAGPSWVASVVNAIGESSYWHTSAIVILWDDWGGWYDNAVPPQLDYRGLGIRVPCLIVSPYAKQGYVSHVQYEYGSVLKFIEEVFRLNSIGPSSEGYTDSRAATLDDAFDFNQAPRAFTLFPPKYPRSHFLHEPPSNEPVDTQ